MAQGDKLADDLKSVTSMGKRLKLAGKELDTYVHKHMTALGYTAQRTYVAASPDGKRGGFFGKDDDDEDDDDL